MLKNRFIQQPQFEKRIYAKKMNSLTQDEHLEYKFTSTDALGFGYSSLTRICVQINQNTQKHYLETDQL